MTILRVYGINLNFINDGIEHQRIVDSELNDREFIEIAEEQGFVWSIKGFENAYNSDDVSSQLFIRFISHEI